jgi:hypothetical protein
MTPHCPANQVVTFNNHAVVQIRDGEYSSAIRTLSQALQASKTLITQQQQRHSNEMSLIVSHFSTEVELSTTSRSCESSDVDDDMYMCKRPLELHITGMSAVNPTAQDADTLAYAVIYNLALCYHLQGIVSGNAALTGQRSLQRAASLYGHARKLLVNAIDGGTMRSLVLFNNMSHAYQLLGDTSTTMKSLRLLVKAMMCLSTTTSNTGCGSDFPLEGFLSNISLLLGSGATAPAA